MLAGCAIQQEVVPVAARLRDHLARPPVEVAVDEDRRLRGVPVVRVVRRDLVVPRHLPGIRIQRDDGARIEVVAGTAESGEHRLGIAGAEVIEIELGIVGARNPRHAATVRHRIFVGPAVGAGLAGARCRVPAPDQVAAFRIARLEVAGDIERVAADTDDDLPADDHGRVGREVLALHVRDLVVPALLAGRHVERDEVVVGRQEVQPVAEYAHATVADVVATARFPRVVPDLPPGPHVQRIDVIGHREVQDAVQHQRRRLDGRRGAARRRRLRPFAADDGAGARGVEPIDPGQRQVPDVGRVDLFERAESPPRVVAVIRRPRVGRDLGGDHGRQGHKGNKGHKGQKATRSRRSCEAARADLSRRSCEAAKADHLRLAR